MPGLRYATGTDAVFLGWVPDPFVWVLADAGITVEDLPGSLMLGDVLAGGHELVDTGYTRQPVTGKTRVIQTGPSVIVFGCDNPTFGTLSDGGTAAWLLLAAVGGSDADSPLVAASPVRYVADGTREAVFTLGAHGPVPVTFNCPADF